MGIFSRFTDIINSNISALLDKAEDPEKMVRLIIQEMEDTLVEVRSTSAKVLAEKKELSRRIGYIQHQEQDWQNKAELALIKDREDLAKAALIEKHKLSQKMHQLQDDMTAINEQLARLKDEISQLHDKLTDAKARQKSIVLRKQTASSRLEVKRRIDSGKIDEAMYKFEQYERKIEGLEAQVDSYDMAKKDQGDPLLNELAELEESAAITDELEALKAKLSSKKSTEK